MVKGCKEPETFEEIRKAAEKEAFDFVQWFMYKKESTKWFLRFADFQMGCKGEKRVLGENSPQREQTNRQLSACGENPHPSDNPNASRHRTPTKPFKFEPCKHCNATGIEPKTKDGLSCIECGGWQGFQVEDE